MPHSGNVVSDQVECLEYPIIEDPFELSKDNDVFSCENNDIQFY